MLNFLLVLFCGQIFGYESIRKIQFEQIRGIQLPEKCRWAKFKNMYTSTETTNLCYKQQYIHPENRNFRYKKARGTAALLAWCKENRNREHQLYDKINIFIFAGEGRNQIIFNNYFVNKSIIRAHDDLRPITFTHFEITNPLSFMYGIDTKFEAYTVVTAKYYDEIVEC